MIYPPRLFVHKDSELTEMERVLRDSIEERIYPLTNIIFCSTIKMIVVKLNHFDI